MILIGNDGVANSNPGLEMRKIMKTGAAALMLTCMAGNVWAATAAAASGCARPDDMTALKAAAIQQKLMVAALSCNAVKLYNDFVTAYQKELQASDRALQNFFRRLNGTTGTESYHAYKTRLANASSMKSIGNITDYCAGAQATFDAALSPEKTNLSGFVSGQDTQDAAVEQTFTPCAVRQSPLVASAKVPAHVPLPLAKPGVVVIPAQGGALTP